MFLPNEGHAHQDHQGQNCDPDKVGYSHEFEYGNFGVFAVATQLVASAHVVPFGFYTGERFLDLNENDKRMYTEGLIDGFLGSGLFGGSSEAVPTLKDCITGMNDRQLAAILKFVKDNPERWQQQMNILGFNALNGACPDLKRAPGRE